MKLNLNSDRRSYYYDKYGSINLTKYGVDEYIPEVSLKHKEYHKKDNTI